MHGNNAHAFYMTGAVSLDTTRNNINTRQPGRFVSRCVPHHGTLNGPLTVSSKKYVSMICMHLQAMHVNNACMFYASYASVVAWKSQNGTKTLVNLGVGKKVTSLDTLRKGCRDFFNFFLTTIGTAHHTYNIQLTKIILMK